MKYTGAHKVDFTTGGWGLGSRRWGGGMLRPGRRCSDGHGRGVARPHRTYRVHDIQLYCNGSISKSVEFVVKITELLKIP